MVGRSPLPTSSYPTCRRARPSAPRTTHGAAEVATHRHGDWLHCWRNLGADSRFGNYPIHGESELFVDPLIRRGFAKALDAHDHAVLPHPPIPGLRSRRLHGDAGHG